MVELLWVLAIVALITLVVECVKLIVVSEKMENRN